MFSAEKNGRNRFCLDIILLLCVSAAVVMPMYFNGIPNGNDLPQHYQFAQTFKQAVADGVIYPRWSAASNGGFGDVGIRFYPPFSYYVLVVAESATGNWYDASLITFCFWFFLSGIGVYLWTREYFSPNASLLAAACYIAAPYHVNQIFNAFTYAEFAAAAILPFCFLFVTRICRFGHNRDVLLLAVSYALLILTHLPMTVIGSISLLCFSIVALNKKDGLRGALRLAVSVGLGLLASSFYWIRMATELDFVNHATDKFRSVAYDFHTNFLAAFLYVSPRDYDERSLWFSDLMLLMTVGLFLPGLLLVVYRWKRDEIQVLKAPIATFCTAIFFATPLSLPIWNYFIPLQQTQFPWRWLSVITLMGSFLVAASHAELAEVFRSKRRPIAILAAGLVIACFVFTATQVIKPAVYISRADLIKRIETLEGGKSYDCWWPVWSQEQAFDNSARAAAENRDVAVNVWNSENRIFTVSPGIPTELRIATFYYPHWKAIFNGTPVTVGKDENGAILIPLGQEKARIRLTFEEPQYVRIANIASLLTALVVFFSFCIINVNRTCPLR